MTKQPRGSVRDAPEGSSLIPAILRAYAGVYERRRAASPTGELFSSSEANASAAVAIVAIAASGASPLSPSKSVATITGLTRRILVAEKHTTASDLAGLAWVRAFGLLAVRRPPVEQIGVVFQAGHLAGRVAGVHGAAWRALFLTEAMPFLNWRQRPVARREVQRWSDYVTLKAMALADQGAEPLGASQAARTAFALSAVAEGLGNDKLRNAGRCLAAGAAELHGTTAAETPAEEKSTAVIAQIVAAAEASGLLAVARHELERLLEARADTERRLLWATDARERYELSPWVPLALLGAVREASG